MKKLSKAWHSVDTVGLKYWQQSVFSRPSRPFFIQSWQKSGRGDKSCPLVSWILFLLQVSCRQSLASQMWKRRPLSCPLHLLRRISQQVKALGQDQTQRRHREEDGCFSVSEKWSGDQTLDHRLTVWKKFLYKFILSINSIKNKARGSFKKHTRHIVHKLNQFTNDIQQKRSLRKVEMRPEARNTNFDLLIARTVQDETSSKTNSAFRVWQGSCQKENRDILCICFHTFIHQSPRRKSSPKRSLPPKWFIKVNNGATSPNQSMPQ